MVDEGVKRLTGKTTLAKAWQDILPNYQPGQGIAVKVNFNNTTTCDDIDNQIDAIAEPVNAIIRGLKSIGVRETDIWIFDAIRAIPNRFTQRMLYSGVRLFDKGCNETASFSSNDPDAEVLLDTTRKNRDAYLRWGRDCLGWGMYLFSAP